MPLTAGHRIGPYEITGALGAGGMGEVYRARDTRLDRDVAIKVLPESFAGDFERLLRFEREARSLAALNHPRIAQVFGIEQSDSLGSGARAIVMELVDGEDLAERLRQGPIPVGEAIAIARQIADALEAAHEAGIIHRDLKPANIKLRSDGAVKVLDFGLAKPAVHGEGARATPGPSITSPAMTMQGVILGTAAYMSPEQAKGKPVDKRADIWAFGCVLYELLAGKRAFGGDDVSDTLAFVLTRDIDWTLLPPATPRGVIALLQACLQKNVRDRLRDIGDARLLLDAVPSADTHTRVGPRRSRWLTLLTWGAALVALAIAAIAIVLGQRSATSTASVTRFVLPVIAGVNVLTTPVLSRDGRVIVYATDRVYYQSLSEFEPRALQGSEGGSAPFISPDGRWVGFYADGKLKKVAVAGGDPQTITTVDADSPGAFWADDDNIYFSAAWNGAPLMSVSANGGEVKTASTLDVAKKERGHWWASWLPDGRHLLFTIWYSAAGLSEARIGVLDLQTGQHRALITGARPQYANGSLIFFAGGVYQVVAFDADRQEIMGQPTPILADAVGLMPQGATPNPVALAANGTVAYLAGKLYPERRVVWIDRAGKETPTRLQITTDAGGDVSPDGRYLAVGRPNAGISQIWLYEIGGPEERRLDFPGYSFDPQWHPDGKRLAFTAMRRGDFDIVIRPIDDTGGEIEFADQLDDAPADWLPDGRALVAKNWAADGSTSIFLFDVERRERIPLVAGSSSKEGAAVSPDGRWLAMCANSTGNWRLYVRALTANAPLQQVATVPPSCGIVGLHWAPKTNELIYSPDGEQLFALQYEVRDGRFTVVRDQPLARVPRNTQMYGFSADGQRLLLGKVASTVPRNGQIHVIMNGLSALKP